VALSLVSYFVVSRRVEAQHRDAQLINIAGRQRMYSQRIALLGQQLALATDSGQRDSLRIDLQQATEDMGSAHAQLIDANSALYPPGTAAQDVQDLYFGNSALDDKVISFLAAATRLQQKPDRQLSLSDPDLIVLESAAQGSLLPALDTVVTIDGIHVEARLTQLSRVSLISMVLSLVVLGVVGLGLLFPLIRRVDRTVTALEDERNFVQQVMDNMGQGLTITDARRRYRYVNPAFARMVGRTPEELIGVAPLDLALPEERQRLLAARERRAAGETSEENISFQLPEGGVIQTLTVVVPYPTNEGLNGIAVVTDLTERIQAEQDLRQRDQQYRTVARNFPGGALLLFDASLRYTLADGQGLKEVGLTSEQMEGKTPHEVFSSEVAAHLVADYRQALLGEVTEYEMTAVGRTYQVRTIPLRNGDDSARDGETQGGVVGGMSIAQDITRRREAEQALLRAGANTEALLEVSRLGQSSLSPEDLALQTARVVGQAADLDWAGLAIREGDFIRTEVAWHSDPLRPGMQPFLELMQSNFHRGQGLIWKVIQDTESLFIDDYPQQPEALSVLIEAGVQNVAYLPLPRAGGQNYVLMLVRRLERRPWTGEDRALFEAAARTVQLSLERHDHVQELERAALIDALTGLGNRRAFERDLEQELERSRRHGESVGVLMVDLDGLKPINDQEGHERGDALLTSFAGTLSDSLRGEDRVYRLGGDEYAAILVRATLSAQSTLETRVRRAVNLTRLAGFPGIDASAGLAFAPGEVNDAGDLLRRADERMYVQKQEHRQARRARLEQ